MKLPNPDRAVVDEAKLRDYVLNPDHPRGQHKARVFRSALGLTSQDAGQLRDTLLRAALEFDAELTENDEHGQRYVIEFEMEYGHRRSTVLSAWIGRHGEDFARLTSRYVV